MAVRADQFRLVNIASIRIVQTEYQQRKPNKEDEHQCKHVGQTGIVPGRWPIGTQLRFQDRKDA